MNTTATKHTPGPWTAHEIAGHATHGQSAVYEDATGKDLAIVYDGAANARLIAAAPDLLAACRAAMEYAPNIVERDRLHAAIAKAIGQ